MAKRNRTEKRESQLIAAHTPAHASGKWHSLVEHLTDVANLAQRYAASFDAGLMGYYAGLWHDIGKFNPAFQEYLWQCHLASESGDPKPPRSVPHAIHGAVLAAKVFPPLAAIIYGHHAGLPALANLRTKLNSSSESALAENCQFVLQAARENGITIEPSQALQENARSFPSNTPLKAELFLRMIFSCLVDADFLDTEEHFDPERGKQRTCPVSVSQLWQALEKSQEELIASAPPSPVNEIRAEVYCNCIEAARQLPGVFRLCVPTGGGKTRSSAAFALRHAVNHQRDHVIVAVPYTSIIEQTVEVYREIFRELGEAAVIEHHSGAREQSNSGDGEGSPSEVDARREYAQARLATENWDAPLVVTTTVQLFESLFARKPSRCRKLHNLANSVIILDEVQTLPTALLEPILNVLRELLDSYGVSIVLCTATQPAFEVDSPYLRGFVPGSVHDIIPPERARDHFRTLSRVRYELPLRAQTWSWKQLIADFHERGINRTLFVLNTRKDTLSVLDTLSAAGFEHLFHLSTLLCGAHRREVLAQVRQRLKLGQPCILVSTQVVEAGVDLDFPLVYRALAPLDRIIQVAGRCNREGLLSDKGRVIIFEPSEGSRPRGEYETACSIAKNLLSDRTLNLDSPDIFTRYFQRLYQSTSTEKGTRIQQHRKMLDYPFVAGHFRLIDSDTLPVIVDYNGRAREILARIKRRGCPLARDRRQLQPYTVNLHAWEVQQASTCCEQIAPDLWLWHGSYDRLYGIGIGDRALAYDPTDLIQ